MTVDIWMVAVLGAILFILVCYIAHLKSKYSEIDANLYRLKENSAKLYDRIEILERSIDAIVKDIEKEKGSRQVDISEQAKRMGDLSRDIKEFKIYISDHLQSVYHSISILADDTNKKVDEKPISAVEYWADKATLADIVDPANLEPPKEEKEQDCAIDSPTYRWIFPSEEPDHEERLIFGQWYTVIGILRSKTKIDGSPMITTKEAMWNRYQFISTDDEPFETVYAYILMPSSADIMEKVVQMALHGE